MSMAHDDDDAENDVCGFQCQLRKTRQAKKDDDDDDAKNDAEKGLKKPKAKPSRSV